MRKHTRKQNEQAIKKDNGPSFMSVWRWAFLILSKLSGTVKQILLTLSVYMNSDGSCFPSIETLLIETSRSRQSVLTAIKTAVDDGWLKIAKKGMGGQEWKRNEYQAAIPLEKARQEYNRILAEMKPSYVKKVVSLLDHLFSEGTVAVQPNFDAGAAWMFSSLYEKKPTDYLLGLFDNAKSKFMTIDPALPVTEYFNPDAPEDDLLTIDDFIRLCSVLEARGQNLKEVTGSEQYKSFFAQIF
jgi:hypothetical protein